MIVDRIHDPKPSVSPYAWIITADHLFDGVRDNAELSDTGTIGPREATIQQIDRLRANEGRSFRIYDDDGELYYSGRILVDDEDAFPEWELAPLDDFGAPNAGATEIRYWRQGKWVTV